MYDDRFDSSYDCLSLMGCSASYYLGDQITLCYIDLAVWVTSGTLSVISLKILDFGQLCFLTAGFSPFWLGFFQSFSSSKLWWENIYEKEIRKIYDFFFSLTNSSTPPFGLILRCTHCKTTKKAFTVGKKKWGNLNFRGSPCTKWVCVYKKNHIY